MSNIDNKILHQKLTIEVYLKNRQQNFTSKIDNRILRQNRQYNFTSKIDNRILRQKLTIEFYVKNNQYNFIHNFGRHRLIIVFYFIKNNRLFIFRLTPSSERFSLLKIISAILQQDTNCRSLELFRKREKKAQYSKYNFTSKIDNRILRQTLTIEFYIKN